MFQFAFRVLLAGCRERRVEQFGRVAGLLVGAFVSVSSVSAADWPFFRGPQQNGSSAETDWRSDWSDGPPSIAWKKQVGIGASSVVVVENRLITMGNEDDQDSVWCLAADTGDVLWTYRYPCKFKDHNYEGGTSSTPTIDGNNVYVLAYDGQLHCLELLTGKLVWKRHLVTDFGGRYSSWDYAASPLVVGNRVILDTGADGNSTVALDKSDGTLLWGNGNDLAGYATPISYRAGNVKMVLVFKARALIAHDVSSGQQVWRIPWKTNYDVNASSPIAVGKQLFVSSGYGGRRARGALFDLQSGNPEEQWVNDDIETKMNSAVVVDEHAYCLSERAAGQLMCVRLKDGVTVWREESFSPYGALMVAAGTLIILDEDGQLVLADAASRGFHQRGRLAVLSSRSWAMPVLANGFIYVRSNAGELVAVDVRKRG